MDEKQLPELPKFANEAEEAQWWFDHREELAQDFASAIKRGELGEGSVARALRKQREAETSIPAVTVDRSSRVA